MIRSKFNTIMILILASMFLFGFSSTYDISTPAGTDDPSEADDRMREIKAATQERLNVSMYFPLTGTEVSDTHAGEMRQIPFHASISDPTQVASHANLYMQFDELRYQDDTNPAFDITSVGKLGSATTDLTVNNATMAGTLEATGLTTVADGSLTKTTAAPTTDAMIANKKYVDDQITANAHAFVQGISNLDSESNAMLKAHAYLAQVDGFVYCEADLDSAGNTNIQGFIHSTSNPAGAGTRVGFQEHTTGSGIGQFASFYFAVPAGWFFEITGTGASLVIRWQSIGSDSKPIDQD